MGRKEFYSSGCFCFGAIAIPCSFAVETKRRIVIRSTSDAGSSSLHFKHICLLGQPARRPRKTLEDLWLPVPAVIPDARSDFPIAGLSRPRIVFWNDSECHESI